MAEVTLLTGGARSGKSRLALELTENKPCTFIATAEASDDEMAKRIQTHAAERANNYTTVETPLDLAGAVSRVTTPFLIIDCITVWLGNLFYYEESPEAASSGLLTSLAGYQGEAVIVTNEVGFGIVPDNDLTRRYRDELGGINQRLAAAADYVFLCVSGINIPIK